MSSRELLTGGVLLIFSVLGLVYLGLIGAIKLYTAGESFSVGMLTQAVPYVYSLLAAGVIGLGLVVGNWTNPRRAGRLPPYAKLAIVYGLMYTIFLGLKASNDVLTGNSPVPQLNDLLITAAGPAVVMILAILFYIVYDAFASQKDLHRPRV